MKKMNSAWALFAATALSPVHVLQASAAEAHVSGIDSASEDIIVTARRRDEAAQDVPLTVNALKADTLAKLNIRDFTDIQTLVPGLTLTAPVNGIAPIASLRGVNFDTNSSGNNGTIQFYLNDAPISAGFLFQSMFDVGQIEVLRGPQGTLRGIASPSGSITVTTHLPDLNDLGGYANGTANTIGGINVNGAVTIPVIKGVLAVRLAGIVNDDESSRVRSITSPGREPMTRSRGQRASVRFAPTNDIEIYGVYQHFLSKQNNYDQVESANLALGLPVIGALVGPFDRAAVANVPNVVRTEFDIFNIRADWGFGPAKLSYVFNWDHQVINSQYAGDIGNVFGSSYPGNGADDPLVSPNLQNYGQHTRTDSKHESHELRLASEDQLFGVADYVIGGLINKSNVPTYLTFQTPVFASSPPTPTNFALINQTPLNIVNRAIERSLFGNLTAHIGENTEISGGIRYIHYKSSFAIIPTFSTGGNFKTTIYSASIKHRFNENVMVYASTGSSWRAGVGTNAIIVLSGTSTQFTDTRLASILGIIPETSKSYEIGAKTDWLDKRLRLNLTYYHQDFKNYIFTSSAINYNGFNGLVYTPGQTNSGLAVGVPVKVDGVEAEVSYTPTQNFNIMATLSYSLGKISGGNVPCNLAALPAPPQQLNFCPRSQRSGSFAPFTASAQSEYTHPITSDFNGVVRAQLSYYGNSQNEPANDLDDVSAYALLNLYLGLRGPDGSWEVTAYGKNIFNAQRVLKRDDFVRSTSYAAFPPSPGGTVNSNYRGIAINAPREFGINLRYAFGAH